MQIWAESGKSALPICNYSQILYQFLTFTQNLKRSQGFYYWGVSLSLAVTIGTAIFILLYMIFSKVAYYAVFSYPFIPLVLVSGLVLLICLIVPIWVYKTDVNLPVVERLRLTE